MMRVVSWQRFVEAAERMLQPDDIVQQIDTMAREVRRLRDRSLGELAAD